MTEESTYIHGDDIARGKLFLALAKARAAFEPILKTAHVRVQKEGRDLYEFDYAPLDEILLKTTKALGDHELALCQVLSGEGPKLELTTILGHSGGAYIQSIIRFAGNEDIQKQGSALTFRRRYATSAILGVSPEDDDDGNSEVGNTITKKPAGNHKPPERAAKEKSDKPKTRTEEQSKLIRDLMVRQEIKTREAADAIAKELVGKDLVELDFEAAEHLITALRVRGGG